MFTCSQTPEEAEQNAHAVAERVHAGGGHVRPEAWILDLAYSVKPSLPLVGGAGSRSEKQAIEEASLICDARHEEWAAIRFKRYVTHYVTIASGGVRRSTKATWSSSPAVSLADFNSVARAGVMRIDAKVARNGWCYCSPVPIDTLSGKKQECAQELYAPLTRADESKIITNVMEDSGIWHQSARGLNNMTLSSEVAANIKHEFLVNPNPGIVSEIVSASALHSTAAAGPVQPSSPLKRSRKASTETCDNAATLEKAATDTHVAAHPRATHKRSREPSTTTPDDAQTPKTKIRRRCGETFTPVRVEIRSDVEYAADIHSAESWQEDGRTAFITTIVETDAAPRDADNKTVFNVMLTDSTGLISIPAWHHHTEKLVSMKKQLEHANEQTGIDLWLRIDLISVTQMKSASGELYPICCMKTFTEQLGTRIQGAPLARSLRDRSMLAAALTLLQRDLENQLWVVDFARLSATCCDLRDLTSEYLRLAAEHEELLADVAHKQAAEQELLRFIDKLEFHDPLRSFDDVLLNSDFGSDCSSD